jgi:hypothetical protein
MATTPEDIMREFGMEHAKICDAYQKSPPNVYHQEVFKLCRATAKKFKDLGSFHWYQAYEAIAQIHYHGARYSG